MMLSGAYQHGSGPLDGAPPQNPKGPRQRCQTGHVLKTGLGLALPSVATLLPLLRARCGSVRRAGVQGPPSPKGKDGHNRNRRLIATANTTTSSTPPATTACGGKYPAAGAGVVASFAGTRGGADAAAVASATTAATATDNQDFRQREQGRGFYFIIF